MIVSGIKRRQGRMIVAQVPTQAPFEVFAQLHITRHRGEIDIYQADELGSTLLLTSGKCSISYSVCQLFSLLSRNRRRRSVW